ncbi:hypothetical protein KC333_g870 [Hortaea werneckii]|uniref:Uncharacterized protein n=2 Tax=Hortaea werneckii TaxID=91943 RepID=A0A3M6ZG52_HORWE|nr:hypothetical protein KC342_g8918 [Hortaea werneckii]KAI6905724.1 hypothetical protein KC334_g5954 [Hortaea werneckii]KAI7095654.1 hypothetical protein KC339_g10897 [Hortaea werneckii]KAI7154557.1 hypothetical protein KC349_g7572 [Hortaea werneckii]KAI7205305.1 hypothetical protein KC324_g353 [Hortaea werneckii]
MSTSLLGLALPKEYGYVLCATASTFFVGFWHGARVSGFRKQSGVPYPKVLAENSDMSAAEPGQKKAMYLFNCAQRAHGNYLENQPSVAIALLVAGVQYPLWSAGLGAAWLVFRIAYAVGYTREDKSGGEGRLIGAPFWFAQLGLFGLTLWTGVQMLL